MKKLIILIGLMVSTMLLMPSCAVTAQPAPRRQAVIVKVRPAPRPIKRVRPRRPGPRYQWVAAGWKIKRGRYVYVPGRWVKPPRRGVRWRTGRWKRVNGGFVWVQGRWVR